MTDLQLALLVRSYAARIRTEYEKATADLPEDALKEGKYLMGNTYSYAPALDGILDVIQ
jgi:hypothetical protein